MRAELINALEGNQIWTKTWDRPIDDLLPALDELAGAIFEEMQVKLTLGEQARGWRALSQDPETWRMTIQTLAEFEAFTPESAKRGLELAEKIYERRAGNGLSENLLASALGYALGTGASENPAADFARLKTLAEQAAEIQPEEGADQALLAFVAVVERRFDDAID